MAVRGATLTLPAQSLVSAASQRGREAMLVWGIFFALFALINGTIPFLLGADLREWSTSIPKRFLIGTVIYGVMFLVVPVALTLGRQARTADLVLLLAFIVASLALQPAARPSGIVVPVALVCLHARYDLSALGFRSRSRRVDLAAIAVLVALAFALDSWGRLGDEPAIGGALAAALDRLLFNPASTAENLFYFGFLTERLSRWLGAWVTPLIVGALYMTHELSNPEYWYGGLNFGLTFVGAVALATLFLARRNVVVVWLADGACRFASRLF